MTRGNCAYADTCKTGDKTRPGAGRIDDDRCANLASIGNDLGDIAVFRGKSDYGRVRQKHSTEPLGCARIAFG